MKINKDPIQQAKEAIDYLMNFCEEYDVRGYDPFHFDDLFQEISSIGYPFDTYEMEKES